MKDLGYTAAKVVNMRLEPLDLILEDHIIRPIVGGVPERWRVRGYVQTRDRVDKKRGGGGGVAAEAAKATAMAAING